MALVSAQSSQTLQVKGSDTMYPLNQAWAAVYDRTTPGALVQVSGGGSRLGIEALIKGETPIAASSRAFTDAELERARAETGAEPIRFIVALDGLAIYVHEDNPITELSIPTARAIFAGHITNWRQIRGPNMPITVFSRNRDSGTYGFFREHVMQGGDFPVTVTMSPSTAALTNAVGRDPRAIGYGGIAFAERVRPLKIRAAENTLAVRPSRDSVKSSTYPLSRPLSYYVNPKLWSADVTSFLEFILSERGQEIVANNDYFPLTSDIISEQRRVLLDSHKRFVLANTQASQ